MHICKAYHHLNGGFRAIAAGSKKWANGSVLPISFLNGSKAQQDQVKNVAKKWLDNTNLSFNWVKKDGVVRIKFDAADGSWSYIGTDALTIHKSKPTMNFGWLDEAVILHEFGHLFGLGHEHQNNGIKWNREQVIKDLSGPPNNWNIATIESNVFAPFEDAQLLKTPFDPKSVMLYYFPPSWTDDGKGTQENGLLSAYDKEMASGLYPMQALDFATARLIFESDTDLIGYRQLNRLARLLKLDTEQNNLLLRRAIIKAIQ